MDAARVAGTGPDGSTTLADVLRQAGRSPPAAARPPPPRTVARTGAEAGQGARHMEAACDAKAVREACRSLATLAAAPPDEFDFVVRLCGTALRDFPGLSGAVRQNGDGAGSGSVDVRVEGPARAVPIRGVDEAGVESIRDALRADRPAPRTPAPGSPEAEAGLEPVAAFVIRAPHAPDDRVPESARGSARRGGAALTVALQSGSIRFWLTLDADAEEEGAAFLDRLRSLCLDPRRALL